MQMTTSEDLEEENHLERALRLSVEEAAYCPDFFQTLEISTLVVMLNPSWKSEEADGLPFIHWMHPEDETLMVIPCFSSMAVVASSTQTLMDLEPSLVDYEGIYLDVTATELFNVGYPGVIFHLNPVSRYQKQIFPDEIGHLIGESSLSVRQRTTDDDIELSLPLAQPDALIFSLTQLFSRYPAVKRAFLVYLKNHRTASEHFLVVVDSAAKDLSEVYTNAGIVAGHCDTGPNQEPVMFGRLQDSMALSEFCLSGLEPFYERAWGQKVVFGDSPYRI